jgi:mannosyl-glycoprotein endo-beta-N-acetylglucosaminidase
VPLSFVSREDWGAKPPKRVTKRDPSTLSGVAVHWFGKPRAAKSHSGCAALLRGIQRDHMAPGGLDVPQGGNDIAYNHAVCPHGKAFTLRGFGVETGANGDRESNETFAAVVYMAGENDARPPDQALEAIAEIIRMWQKKGAGPLVKPHQFFTGSDCPGPNLLKWVAKKPAPWKGGSPEAAFAVEDETPDWLFDFIEWRLVGRSQGAPRPKGIPKEIPPSAWEATARMSQVVLELGPRDPFLDWVEWRRRGAKKNERPRSVPKTIPAAWKQSFKRLDQLFTGKLPPKPPRPQPGPPVPETPTKITPQTTLLAEPRVTLKRLEKFEIGRKHGVYTDANVRGILKKYVTLCTRMGLDPLLVVSQMLEETGHLTSPKSQPPQRNPAGIGATGGKVEGASFATWDNAIRAHVGRLLAYALAEGEETPAQRALIKEALKVRSLPADRRGCAPVLAGLAGKWAMDPDYAVKISAIANQIRPL